MGRVEQKKTMSLCAFAPNGAAAAERGGNHLDGLFDRFDHGSEEVCLVSDPVGSQPQ